MSWIIPRPGDYPPQEQSRRLKQVPIHALVSHVLQNHKLGDPCHELALQFLGKWQETHTAAEIEHETTVQLRKDREFYLRLIRDLQGDILMLKEQRDALAVLTAVLSKPRLMLK